MFYLKYRPKTISEIDNTRVKEFLKKILESADLPHALLFIGQKGTGKTSLARILAKSVNCLNNKFAGKTKGVEPCNQCSNCISITNSTFTDVIEMDAASNRGIEEIKNLIKETSYSPMLGKYRVFIIDEAHMITADGFNALLKTLEEPPATSIFILATTNLERIPKTIASRCVRLNFGKAYKIDIIRMLHRISSSENLNYSKEVLDLISHHSDYSFRDAAKLLEEITIQKIKDYNDVEKFLGLRGKNNLLEIIENSDLNSSLTWINDFSLTGGSFKNLIEDLLFQLRSILLMKKGVDTEDKITTKFSTSEIITLIRLLMNAYNELKYSPIESLPIEIAISEFYNKRSEKSL